MTRGLSQINLKHPLDVISGDLLISRIEAHSFKSMPAAVEEEYDGWLLRLSKSKTKRINSVNFLKKPNGALSLQEKITYCESYYNKHHYPCRFRVTPLASPTSLENELSNKDYQPIDTTDVLVQNLANIEVTPASNTVSVEIKATQEWLETICTLTGRHSEEEKKSLKDILDRIEIETCFASIQIDGKIVACGLATFDDGIMGLFEIATSPNHQRKGLGRDLINQLLNLAIKRGVKIAYLQVVQSNQIGRLFWNSMGFSDRLYGYQYWIQPHPKESI
ncbi:MAG: GNAT family N-acetyltransferase [Sneathiella sp.]